MRYRLILTLLITVLLALSAGFATVYWSKGGAGAGLYSRHWSPEPVQGYWDPDNFYQSPDSVQGVFKAELCIQCHEGITPGIVADWRASRHAQGEEPVYCSDCHGNDTNSFDCPPRMSAAVATKNSTVNSGMKPALAFPAMCWLWSVR